MWRIVLKVVLWRKIWFWLLLGHWILCFLNSLGLFFSPKISAKLLVHKIQSPQEWEAFQSLTVCFHCLILPHFASHQTIK